MFLCKRCVRGGSSITPSSLTSGKSQVLRLECVGRAAKTHLVMMVPKAECDVDVMERKYRREEPKRERWCVCVCVCKRERERETE